MNSDDRHLDFNTFINLRSQEIFQFNEALQQDTTKKGHQSVPKSLRRRAMSHNRYRIPLRIRKPMESDLAKAESMQKLPKCRKSIRKKHRLLVSYRMRSQKNKWLPTHLWACKRMRMVNYYKYKIAYTPNDKSFRSGYRHFRHNCCLLDLSYLQCLSILLETNALPNSLKIINDGHQIINTNNLKIDKLYHAKLFSEHSMICTLFVVPKNILNLYCFFDPCCRAEIQCCFQDKTIDIMNYQIGESPCQIYMMLGPLAIQRARQALQKLSITHKQFEDSGTIGSPSNYPPNKIYYFIQNKPKVKSPDISTPIPTIIKTGYNPADNKILRQQFNAMYKSILAEKNQKKPDNNKAQQFWSYHEQEKKKIDDFGQFAQELMIKVSSRSKYTHKRKNKLTKEQKKKLLIQEKERKELQAQQGNLVKGIEMQAEEKIKNSLIQNKSKFGDSIGPIALAVLNTIDPDIVPSKNSTVNIYGGCFIFCDSSQHCRIWRILTRLNTKVIGHRQYKHCLLQSGIRKFPQDFPQTKSFNQYWSEQSMKKMDKHKRLPYQKRPNYFKIRSPFPFYPSLKNFVPHSSVKYVQIDMVSRGVCETGSYICQLKGQDFEKINEYMENQSAIKHIFHQQITQLQLEEMPDFKSDSYFNINEKLKKIHENNMTDRKVIGFITAGGYLYSKCREGGLGFIIMDSSINSDQQISYILIRKPTSRYYFLATVIQ